MIERWHRWVDHTSEVQLQVSAESLAGLAAEAGRALGLLVLRQTPANPEGPPGPWRFRRWIGRRCWSTG